MRSLAAYFVNRGYPLHAVLALAIALFTTTDKGAVMFGEAAFVVNIVFGLAAGYFIAAPRRRAVA